MRNQEIISAEAFMDGHPDKLCDRIAARLLDAIAGL